MRIGMFTSVFERETLGQRLAALCSLGLDCTQFNLSDAGLPSMPEQLEAGACDRIREEFADHGVEMSAVNGTFNMIHPDPEERRAGLRQLQVVADNCKRLGTSVITLCTGTRDPHYMWRAHPANDAPDAWDDLIETMGLAVGIAETAGVTLAFEPEVANVIDSAGKARRLLDTIGSPRLKVVLDGANIFHAGELPRQHEILAEAARLLGPDIAIAHAKDLTRDGAAGNAAAGTGLLDYNRYLTVLQEAGFTGPLILHGLTEAQAPTAVAFVRQKLTQLP